MVAWNVPIIIMVVRWRVLHLCNYIVLERIEEGFCFIMNNLFCIFLLSKCFFTMLLNTV